jgi:hypothetical protein
MYISIHFVGQEVNCLQHKPVAIAAKKDIDNYLKKWFFTKQC